MKYYKIKESETIYKELIGTVVTLIEKICLLVESRYTTPYYQTYYKCDTAQGELLFYPEDLEKLIEL